MERRAHERFPLTVEVTHTSEHNFFTGFMEDISEGGIFVATHAPVEIGDKLELTFSVPGMPGNCTLVCRVRWLRAYNPDSNETIPGMGLSFDDLPGQAKEAIDRFIKQREPIFYED